MGSTESGRRDARPRIAYEGFSGDALLHRLVEQRDLRALEVLWRLGDPGVAARIAPHVLEIDVPELSGLVVEEILSPGFDEPLPTAVVQELERHRPRLSRDVATRLVERLQAEDEPLLAAYENARYLLEAWVVEQEGTVGADFALAVVRGETRMASHARVRDVAFRRCTRSRRLLGTAGAALVSELNNEPSPSAWEKASAMVQAAAETGSPPTSLHDLATELLVSAPAHAPENDLPHSIKAFAVGDGRETLRTLIVSEPMQPTQGAQAVISAIEDVEPVRDRHQLFALGLHHQPQLWNVLGSGLAAWDQVEWRGRLRALADTARFDPAPVRDLIKHAPVSTSADIIEFAMSQADGSEAEVLGLAATRLRERFAAFDDNTSAAERLGCVRWPRARETGRIELLSSVLRGALDEEELTALVVEAFRSRKIAVSTAAVLLPTGRSLDALGLLEHGDARARLARALADARPDELGPAVERLQTEGFSFDLAVAIAEKDPAAAFAGADQAYPSLSSSERDTLVELLERHGGLEQGPAVDAVMADDRQGTAGRRQRVARRVAELTEPRAALPAWMLKLLGSGNADLRTEAIRSFERVKPRDPEVIRELRKLAVSGGVPGDLSRAALDSIAEDILGELGDDSTKEEARSLLPLLGATGSPHGLPTLFSFVGPDPRWDDEDLRRLAAAAVADIAGSRAEIPLEEQTRLVGLVEGAGAEIDPSASESLKLALSRIQLGEDDALRVLYDEFLPKPPQTHPDELFGGEKETLLRHVDLYEKAKAAGASGHGRQLAQLDILAASLARAAYLQYGTSEPLKAQIRASRKQEEYGNLIGSIGNVPKMRSIKAELEVIRNLRSEKSMEAHPGEQPTADDIVAARQHFKKVATVCVQLLEGATKSAA